MRFLLALAFCLATNLAHAGKEMLVGSWEGGDTASLSIYGTMHISEKNISWGGHNKFNQKCEATYTVEPNQYGVSFKDQTGNTYVTSPDSKFSSYLLNISGGECVLGISQLRLTFPFENEFRYLAVVEYDKSGKPVGWMHFHKRDQNVK